MVMNGASAFTFGTRFSRVLVGVLVAGYITQLFVPSTRQFLALVAGRFIPCVWNVFTAGFLETSIVQLVIDGTSLLVLSSIIEPLWGATEFAKFLAISNTAAGVASLVSLYVTFAVTYTGSILYLEVSGFHGCIGACLVAVKSLLPDTEITVLKVLKIQAKHLAGLYVLVSGVYCIILGPALTELPQVLAGTYTAWFYLRFLQPKQGLHLRGDPSADFRFATFFPEVIQGPIDRLAGMCATVFRLQVSENSNTSAAVTLHGKPLPGSDSNEAARRRERGAKVLEERLKASLGQKSDVIDVEAPEITPDKNGGN